MRAISPLTLGFVLAALCTPVRGAALPACDSTPTYSPCEIEFQLNEQEAAAHPNPYLTVELQVEFRSPKFRTFRMPAFWDGERRMVVRFTPIDAGAWDYRVSSNVARFEGVMGKFAATDSGSPGFIRPANVHHWATTETNQPHLWMGDTNYRFATMDRTLFEYFVSKRAEQKFNHLRGLVLADPARAYPSPDKPDPAYFREMDERVLLMNKSGIVFDLILGGDENELANLFASREQRERYVRYLVARYSPMNITWQGVQEFEEYENGRDLLRELGGLLKKLDPYGHPRSTHAVVTSSPLLPDGWMTHIIYQSSDNQLGAIEHQIFGVPQVNAEFAYEDSGAGKSHPHHVDTNAFRARLWNSTMNGQYPTFGNTGTYGGKAFPLDAKFLDSPGAKQMTVWYDFFAGTRHWELQPYFDVDGGRAVALDEVEYIVYVEKPSGPVEVLVARHNYDVRWFNPLTGEYVPRKNYKGERFVGEPPDTSHDWVLHISREGRKQGMLRSYKFESRRTLMQEIERNPTRVPFEIVQPSSDEISFSKPQPYSIKLTRETRATRSMMYLWTGEVSTGRQGARVLGTGVDGTLRSWKALTEQVPGVLNLRVHGMNANGKVYAVDRVYRLAP